MRSAVSYSGLSRLVRAEPKIDDGGTELGQQAEPLHELGLDPQHPPRVGVHPVGRAAPVQQPLVRGRLRYLLATQRGGSLAADPPVRLGISVHRATKGSHRRLCA